MENSKKIQIGLLVLVGALLLVNIFGGFDGLFGGSSSDSVRDQARKQIATTTDVNANPSTPAMPATPAEPAAPAGPTTTMDFSENEFDFGTVDQGEKVTHVYKFTNTGSEPLIISNAKGSCGCTVPSWPKEPIAVGATGEIKVQFDSKGKKGKQSKRVTLTANTDPVQTFLTIKGEVNAPEGEAATTAPISVEKK